LILQLKSGISEQQAHQIAQNLQAFCVFREGHFHLVTSSGLKTVPSELEQHFERTMEFADDMQLSSRKWLPATQEVSCRSTLFGDGKSTVLMAGPCSVESEEQLESIAAELHKMGLSTLRAGAYKPRTSPYTFQGLGKKGLLLLDAMRSKYGLNIITEVRDSGQVDEVIEFADIIQIGAKAMYDQGILRRCATAGKPVMIKRGFGSTLQELVQAAEFVLSGGNSKVMLCERGIRTFETRTRFTLDLCGVSWLKEHCNLPIILDPSHAMGYAYGVPDLSRACVAMGVDGLLIEVHPDPKSALSDASQQLNPLQFRDLVASLHPVAKAVGRQIV
jgi:3-deoxy-7-phosphoheptulonate synthase